MQAAGVPAALGAVGGEAARNQVNAQQQHDRRAAHRPLEEFGYSRHAGSILPQLRAGRCYSPSYFEYPRLAQ